jgi:hypothetical protein
VDSNNVNQWAQAPAINYHADYSKEIIMALTNEEKALAARYSPLYQQAVSAQQDAAMKRQAELSAAQLQGGSMLANRDKYLGTEQRLGIPSVDPRYRTVQGTGFNAPNIDPMRKFMAERNYEMGSSGVPELGKQGLSNSQAMQSSINSGINTIEGKKWDKANIPLVLPNAYQEYQLAQKQGFNGSFMDYKQAIKSNTNVSVDIDQGGMAGALTRDQKIELGIDPDSAYVWAKDGTPKSVSPTNFSDAQLQSAGFGERMDYAEDIFSGLAREEFDPTSLMQVIGDNMGSLGGYAMTEQQQAYQQAMHDWVRAKLRKESGAVIGDDEMAKEIATYFPKPGEGPRAIAQKVGARERATRALARQSGGAYEMKEREAIKYEPSKNQNPVAEPVDYDSMTDEELQKLLIEREL